MQQKVINQLLNINRQFYTKNYQKFHQTRMRFWLGWHKLLPYIRKIPEEIKILDIACGNGRFAGFLLKHMLEKKCDYLGLDQNAQLIKKAQDSYRKFSNQFRPINFHKLDIIQKLINKKCIKKNQYNLVTIFGFLHHIPSKKLRRELFSSCFNLITKNGWLIFSTWQFIYNKKLMSRRQKINQANININDLEKNDYLLDWNGEDTNIRYCHYTDEEEVFELIGNNWIIINQFFEDGIDAKQNKYYILQSKK